ncbi:MAG TPA: glycosyltransferase family 4 protein [Phycisphaerae bacterium]|nr:glycosyltransferase family 4 protein [Phycisphaerae bacterium]HRW54593.1 glycosyltransferase family 4 protein [Phycisphaerae bacterium]
MLSGDWRILLSLPLGLGANGMTTWAFRTARALADRGRRVTIVAHDAPQGDPVFDAAELDLPNNAEIARLPALRNPEHWERILDGYRRLLPAVLIPTTIEQSFEVAAAVALCAPSRVRVIGWNHVDHEYDYTCLRHIEPICSAFIANTRQCTERLDAHIPHRSDDIARIPHVLGAVEPRPPASSHNGPIRIGYAGRLVETQKRVADLLEVASILESRGVPFQMRIVGDGPSRDTIASFADQFNLRQASANESPAGASRIELSASTPPTRIHEFWSDCDCLLLPSVYEGLSMQLIEAMQHGCVPIVSARSGEGDVIEGRRNGLTFEVGDCEAAADCVAALAGSPQFMRQLAEAARQTIAALCAPAATIDRLDAIIESAIEAPDRRWPRTRPLSVRATSSGAEDSASQDAARMRSALTELANRGGRAVAIYGAGRHTQSIATAFINPPVEILAFIEDDRSDSAQTLWEWPILSRAEAIALDIDAVIISSRMNEAQMLRHQPEFASAGIELLPLYSEGRAAIPFSTSRRRPKSGANSLTQTTPQAHGVAGV